MANLHFIVVATIFLTVIGVQMRPDLKVSSPISPLARVRSLLIDNYDSYTYNVWQLLADVNAAEPIVVLNDQYSDWQELVANVPQFDNIVISPGPGNPTLKADFGLCAEAIMKANVPIFGVCLGHQGIASTHGGSVEKAPVPVHGRLFPIKHTDSGLFKDVPQDSRVVRYHSLHVRSPLPAQLRPTAWTHDGLIMGLEHTSKPIYGVQFHPESVATESGRTMFSNFKSMTLDYLKKHSKPLALPPKTYATDVTVDTISTTYDTGFRIPANDSSRYDMFESSERDDSEVSGANSTTRYTHIERITTDVSHLVQIQDVFASLYEDHAAAFWLDSCVAPEKDRSADAYQKGKPKLSFIGAVDTDAGEIVEYYGKNEVIVRASGKSDVDSLANTTIFDFIDTKIQGEETVTESVSMSDRDVADATAFDIPFDLKNGMFGYIGYEARHEVHDIITNSGGSDANDSAEVSSSAAFDAHTHSERYRGNLTQPTAMMMMPSRYIAYDHTTGSFYIVSSRQTKSQEEAESNLAKNVARSDAVNLAEKIRSILSSDTHPKVSETQAFMEAAEDQARPLLRSTKTREQYLQDINDCLGNISYGETYEVCMTARFSGKMRKETSPFDVYKALRKRNPAPYSSFIHYDPVKFGGQEASEHLQWYREGGLSICSSSPERYLKIDKDRVIESKPIKGTSRRDLQDAASDAAIAYELEHDEKSKAENLMIVDLVRNDLGRVCEVGSVHVPQLMKIETFATVHQMVSTVRGTLLQDKNVVDALIATFPGGSMTGAPKLRTMEIIDNLEKSPRGVYSGGIGYIGYNGATDLNIVIRTAVIKGDELIVGSGGAIVTLSDPEKEVDEVLVKAQAVCNAIGYTVNFADEQR
jgi:para-aminobenzoate synthetase